LESLAREITPKRRRLFIQSAKIAVIIDESEYISDSEMNTAIDRDWGGCTYPIPVQDLAGKSKHLVEKQSESCVVGVPKAHREVP